MSCDALTRRSFLRYGTATVGSLTYAAAVGPLAGSLAAATPALELTAGRQETLRALIEAVGAVAPHVDSSRADEVVASVAAAYRVGDATARRNVEILLDAAEPQPGRGALGSMPSIARVRYLCAKIGGRDEAGRALPGPVDSERCALIKEAVAFAAAPFYDIERPWSVEQFLMA